MPSNRLIAACCRLLDDSDSWSDRAAEDVRDPELVARLQSMFEPLRMQQTLKWRQRESGESQVSDDGRQAMLKRVSESSSMSWQPHLAGTLVFVADASHWAMGELSLEPGSWANRRHPHLTCLGEAEWEIRGTAMPFSAGTCSTVPRLPWSSPTIGCWCVFCDAAASFFRPFPVRPCAAGTWAHPVSA